MRLPLARGSFVFASSTLAASLLAGGCTVSAAPDASRMDAPAIDSGSPDTPAVSCTTAAECDDELDCTFDDCIVGNVCSHMALDTLCEDGERCDPSRGCTSGCTTVADCNVGRNYCDGTFACAGGTCVPSVPRNCDDGNECTTDSCDPAAMEGGGGCVYSTATGCDGGVGGTDGGGPVCDPFDPATGYTGTFRLLPPQGIGCSAATYTLTGITLSTTGSALNASGAPSFRASFTGPLPSDENFTLTATDEYGTYTLTGTFVCANRFTGTYTYRPSGAWSVCGMTTEMVVGRP